MEIDHDLIETPGSRSLISTPALLIDLDLLENNLLKMADFARRHKVSLRPSSKVHQSPFIADLQIKAGAIGISCDTLEEAEIMVNEGIKNVLITSPICHSRKIKRLAALHEKTQELLIVVESSAHIKLLSQKVSGLSKPLKALVLFSSSTEKVISLAQELSSHPLFQFMGVQATFQDNLPDSNQILKGLVSELSKNNLSPSVVTGGSTASFEKDASSSVYTDLQVGSYLFMDVQHNQIDSPFTSSLFVLTSVISSEKTFAITDGGLKAFGGEGSPQIPSLPLLTYQRIGDEKGKISWDKEQLPFDLGNCFECIPYNANLTVNLYTHFYCVRKDVLVSIWPIMKKSV